jgi:hypothetical protein
MAQSKYYLGYTDSGTDYYYYLDTNQDVQVTTTPTYLKYAPKDKDASKITEERKFTYHGVFRSYSTPVEFVKDGAKILRHLFTNGGINAECWFRIAVFDASITVNDFVEQYRGDVDFSRYSSTRFGVKVEIMERGFPAKLTSGETTDYELEMADSSEKIWVRVPPIPLKFKQRWESANGEYCGEDILSNHYPTLSPSTYEGSNISNLGTYNQAQSITPIKLLANDDDTNSLSLSLEMPYAYNIHVQNVVGAVSARFQYGYFVFDSANTLVSTNVLFSASSLTSVGSTDFYSGTVTASITLAAGQYISVFARGRAASNLANVANVDIIQVESPIIASVDQLTPVFYIPCRSLNSIGAELVDKIGEGNTSFTSTLLGTTYNNLYAVSGDAAINLPKSKLKTTFADFYKSVNGILCATMLYDRGSDTCSIEQREDAYDNTSIIDVGAVSGMTYTPLVEELFTNLKIGYENQTYDDINGKDEPNQETSYKTPLVRTLGDKDYKSKYRSDHYGLVFHCLNLNGKTETDSEPDNNIWILDVDVAGGAVGYIPYGYTGVGEPYYELKIDTNIVVSNVYKGDTYFNISLSPARNLKRHGKYIHALLWNNDTKYVTFQSATKSNYTGLRMSTEDTITSEIINEGGDWLIGDFDTAYFKPIIFKFTAVVDSDFKAAIEANPLGYITFVHNGNIFNGFILKIEYSIDRPEAKTFDLLCTWDTDTSKLIY